MSKIRVVYIITFMMQWKLDIVTIETKGNKLNKLKLNKWVVLKGFRIRLQPMTAFLHHCIITYN